jgi:GAF domain-containing protein
MFNVQIEAASKPELYARLIEAADAITAGEPDAIANMANLSALAVRRAAGPQLGRLLPQCRRRAGAGAVPGQGACIRIPFGKGVCGAAAATREVQLVEDVHAFPGHIACDAASRRSWWCRSSTTAR